MIGDLVIVFSNQHFAKSKAFLRKKTHNPEVKIFQHVPFKVKIRSVEFTRQRNRKTILSFNKRLYSRSF